MEWMILPFKRYAEFSGRSRRKEYWMYTLFVSLVGMAFGFYAGFEFFRAASADAEGSADLSPVPVGLMVVLIVFALATVIPSLAVQVRRFHDQDKTGWLILLGLIPFIGGIILLVFMCLDGTPGPNRFGPDPKGRAA
jgi:uncharacterized membrane protein YhaH (DUF805 family)